MKLSEESDEILENDITIMDMKTRNRLTRIDAMLQEKLQLISELDEKILTACVVDDTIKEVEDAEFFKMCVMDAIANVSTSTTPPVPTISSPQGLNKTVTALIPPLQHRPLATPQLLRLQHQPLATIQIRPFQHRLPAMLRIRPLLATLRSFTLQHRLLPAVRLLSIHQHLTRTPI